MPFLAILVGVVLFMAAYNNTQDQLTTALETDLPGFLKWGAAVLAIAGIGYIPGFRQLSRILLALVIVAIVMKNYQAIFNSFQNITSTAPTAGQPISPATPTQTFVQSTTQEAGFGGGGTATGGANLLGLGSGTGVTTSGLGSTTLV